jgi:hypothetical protein
MDPVMSLIVPGFVGGLFVALWLVRANRRSRRVGQTLASGGDVSTTDAINIAHIKVAGVGGLGLVVMALVVAAFIPSIGVALAIGAALGTIFALVLILWRRQAGPMKSSGRRPGANTTLSIETVESPADDQAKDTMNLPRGILAPAWSKRSWL